MAKKVLLVLLAVIVLVVLWGVGQFISVRNTLVQKREDVKQKWSQVENVMQRRADLIPNLVATVKGYAAHEQKVFDDIAAARAALGGARSPQQAIAANNQLDGALSRLLVVVENYPNLKADQQFLNLQAQLEGTENRIAQERRRYNESVQDYNTYLQLFPHNIFASLSGFSYNNDYFKANEAAKEVPKVDFGK
ncbi:MAG: LemA family protein [Acidobacteriia bacterium]|nr:LemA family protein [Terriglobia bacterium]